MTITYPDGPLLPNQVRRLTEAVEPQISYTSPDEYATWHLMGPKSPIPGVQEGVIVLRESIKGMLAPWQTLDQAGANQDGVTFVNAVYSPAEIDMMVEAHGLTAAGTRKVIRDWIQSWDAKQPGVLTVSGENGDWSGDVRWLKVPTDPLMRSSSLRQRFLWTCRLDSAFWYGTDSVSTLTSSGNLRFTNTGDQPAWPRYLVYGPGTFKFANGPGGELVEFGDLLANQIVLIETEPRRRSIVDLTTEEVQVPAPDLTRFQDFIYRLIRFAANGNTVPLLERFESRHGISPPQGNLYSFLKGRFNTPIPAAPLSGAEESVIACEISGGGAGTKVVGAITPRRRWPL